MASSSSLCVIATDIHVAWPRRIAQAACMSRELERGYQRAARVFLARLLIVHGPDAPHVLRRIADELERFEAA